MPAEHDQRQADLDAQEAAFAERERRLQRRENAIFVAGLTAAGRLPPGHRARVLDLMERLDGSQAVDFGEGPAKVTVTPLAAFREFLSGVLPVQIEFAELSGKDRRAPETSGGPDGLAQAAGVYMAEEARQGRVVSAAEAVRHVRGLLR